MLVSLDWLKTYLPDLDKTPEELDEALTLIGFEVEDIHETGLPPLQNVVVGEVLEKAQHPNADRLSLCQVDVGTSENASIVCGATNYKVGDRVPVALPGAELPGGFVIKKTELRGVPSAGMMCSAKELGLGDDHAGLLILEDRPEIGTPINDLYSNNDTIIDVEITPNRPDCFSHIGIARELAAYFGLKLKYPDINTGGNSFSEDSGKSLLKGVTIEAPETCLYYSGYSIEGVKIAPSPSWLRQRIEAIGLRPINNVVDITNFVLHEYGQPLHAFDAGKIKGQEIIIRNATEEETITTLDEKERKLQTSDTLIADAERGLVVAGVMGSIDAEVDDNTTDIVLEAAWFTPKKIRKTSRQLGLSTDSSYRFERGVDPVAIDTAAYRTIDLILEIAGGTLHERAWKAGSNAVETTEIEITPDFIRERCGFGPEDEAIKESLTALEIEVNEGDSWKATIPSYRGDLTRPVDLVEEFLRIYGTDKIPEADVESRAFNRNHTREWTVRNAYSQYMRNKGYAEVYNYSLILDEETRLAPESDELALLALKNPISSDQTHLRPSMIPGLLNVLKRNQQHHSQTSAFYEWGRCYRKKGNELVECVAMGWIIQETEAKQWLNREPTDFFKLKAMVIDILRLAGVKYSENLVKTDSLPSFAQEGQFAVMGDIAKSGTQAEFGLLNLKQLKEMDIEGLVYAVNICITPDVLERKEKPIKYTPYTLFPPSYKDLALVADKKESASKIREALAKAGKAVSNKEMQVDAVELFDVYEGTGLEENQKSLAFNITFRGTSGTLKDEVVNKAFEEMQSIVEKKSPYRVRR